jgi:hypothetical protein
MRAVRRTLLLLVLAAAPFGARLQAADAKIGRIAPDGATSQCVGANTSPTCMTETLLACFARGDAALCRNAGIADPRSVTREPSVIEYVIERISVIRAEDVTEDMREVEWFKPGYALVELRRRSCPPPGSACAAEGWDDLQVYLRPRNGLWEIVTFRGELESESAPEIPETFQPPGKGP